MSKDNNIFPAEFTTNDFMCQTTVCTLKAIEACDYMETSRKCLCVRECAFQIKVDTPPDLNTSMLKQFINAITKES